MAFPTNPAHGDTHIPDAARGDEFEADTSGAVTVWPFKRNLKIAALENTLSQRLGEQGRLITDFDDHTEAGWARAVSGAANAPLNGASWAVLYIPGSTPNLGCQIAIADGSVETWVRYRQGGNFVAWTNRFLANGRAADAQLLHDMAPSTGIGGNTIAQRNAAGDFDARILKSVFGIFYLDSQYGSGNSQIVGRRIGDPTTTVNLVLGGDGRFLVDRNPTSGAVVQAEVVDTANLSSTIQTFVETRIKDRLKKSNKLAFAENSSSTFAHGLGATPSSFGALLYNKVAEGGHNPGSILKISSNENISISATNAVVRISFRNGIGIPTANGLNTFTITPANWELLIFAEA